MDDIAQIDIGDEIHWQPHRLVFPGSWAGHIPFAFWLIKALRPRVLVELGTHTGNSYGAFCQSIAHFGTSTRAFAVDSWQGDDHADFYGEEVFADVSEHNRANYASFSTLMRMFFEDARPYFADGSVDLLHIDGLHTYDAVKADFEGWRDKLSDRGVVLFHDTNVRERDFGVWKLWAEISDEYPSFEFHHSHGLGVLGVGRDLPESLKALFEASSNAARGLRRQFERPGELLLQRSRMIEMTRHFTKVGEQLRDALQLSEAEREKVSREHAWTVQLLGAKDGLIAGRDALLSERENQLRARDAMVREAQARNQQALEELALLRASVAPDPGTASLLPERIAQLERELHEAREEVLKLAGSHALLHPQAADPKADVQAIHALYQSSASWRLTKPFRVASRVARRLLRGAGSPPAAEHPVTIAPETPLDLPTGQADAAEIEALPVAETVQSEQVPSASGLKASVRQMMSHRLSAFLTGRGRLRLPRSEAPDISVVLVLYNQAELTYACLSSVVEALSGSALTVEVIICDNGSSDRTDELLGRIDGATIIRNEENLHFLRGVNAAASHARGRHLLLLNNDTQVTPGSLDRAVELLDSDPTIGAVGGRLVLPDGTLQEAGSIIFSDGSCMGYGRSHAVDESQFMFQRDVDYCSGAFLMTPRAAFERLGGFDVAFAPAYYEETDYCVRLRKEGLRIVFDPQIVTLHFEFGSSAASDDALALQQRNWATFRRLHGTWLATQLPSSSDPATLLSARNALDGRPRLLMIEDRIPHRQLGAGYPRSNDLVRELDRRSHLTFFPMFEHPETWQSIRQSIPDTVEVIKEGSSAYLEAFLRARRGSFDAIVIARPHNMSVLTDIVERDAAILAGAKIIYDAEAIFARRTLLQSSVLNIPLEGGDPDLLVAREVALTRHAHAVISVSEDERRTYIEHGAPLVTTVGFSMEVRPTPASFDERETIVFLGPAHDDNTPNSDSLRWFAEAILPRLRADLGDHIRLRVIGMVTAPSIQALAEAGAFELAGRVDDLAEEMNRARLVVVPTRFSAGIPLKAQEVASFGVPIVSTDLIAEQLGWTAGQDLLSTNDPEAFASSCAELYRSKETWERLRANALARVASDCSPERFSAAVEEALAIVEPRDERALAIARLLDRAGEEDVLPRYVGRPLSEDASMAVPFSYRPAPPETPKAAAIVHAFYPDLVPEILRYLRNIPFPIDLFFSTDSEEKRTAIEAVLEGWANGSVAVRVFPNRGRDIAPKIVGFADVYPSYDYVLHLHSKASLHEPKLAPWRRYLLETLVGSPAVVSSITEVFEREPSVGLVAPQHYDYIRRWLGWENNFSQARRVAARMGISLSPEQALDFPSGSMFWARSAALKPILDLNLTFDDFPDESRQTDGTLAHVIERLYYYAAESAGFSWVKVARPEFMVDARMAETVVSPRDLQRFVVEKTPTLSGPVRLETCPDAPAVIRTLPPALAALTPAAGEY